MKKVLHIISSPRGNQSFSIKLGNAIIDNIKAKYSDTIVEELNLIDNKFPVLEEVHITSFFTPEESRTEAQAAAASHSDKAISQINEADIIVIGAPLYNFGVHASLKAWIDHIVRAGVTFSYGEAGPVGLIKNKKVYIALASGGIYSQGPATSMDFVSPYLRSILSFIGLDDISVFRIEGTAYPDNEISAVEKGMESIVID